MYKDIILGFEFELESHSLQKIYDFIDKTYPITGYNTHHINEYHQDRLLTKEGKWRVERDSSVQGAEFVSPPIQYYLAKEMVEKFFKEIEQAEDITTTTSCGLHVGMSINGTIRDVNLSNFVISLNPRLITSLWTDRAIKNNSYCKNISKLLPYISVDQLNNKNLVRRLLTTAYGFVTVKTMFNVSYIELRVPGGINYHHKFKELFALIDHVAEKLLLSCSELPKNINREYNKKIASYINRTLSHHAPLYRLDRCSAAKLLDTEKDLFNRGLYSVVSDVTSYIKLHGVYQKEICSEKLNKHNYIYFLIRHCILLWDRYDTWFIKNLLDTITKKEFIIDIPKKEPVSKKLKVLKHWNVLPLDMLTKLLISLDNKAAYRYILRYKKELIHHISLSSGGNSILERCGVLHAYKYQKVDSIK